MPSQPLFLPACSSLRRQAIWRLAIGVWSLAVIVAFAWMTRYEFSTDRPDSSKRATVWPHESLLPSSSQNPTLLLFVHPRCPCTRATIRELRRVLEHPSIHDQEQPEVRVVVSMPSSAAAQWDQSDTIQEAQRLPRATLFFDRGGVESHRFGAATSGTVMLYSTAGRQLYAGGVTVSRGHEGDSLGAARLRDLLRDPAAPPGEHAPAFGCRLCLPVDTTAQVSVAPRTY